MLEVGIDSWDSCSGIREKGARISRNSAWATLKITCLLCAESIDPPYSEPHWQVSLLTQEQYGQAVNSEY